MHAPLSLPIHRHRRFRRRLAMLTAGSTLGASCLTLPLLSRMLTPTPGTAASADNRPSQAVTTLARLAAERVLTADQVAASKWVSGRPIEDPARERQVLADMDVRARELGVDRATAQRIFEDQIEASKIVQRRLHDRWSANPQEAPTEAPDLTRVRDRINRINAEMLAATREAQPLLAAPECPAARDKARARVAKDMRLEPPYRQGLHRALERLCGTPRSEVKK